MGIVLKEFSKVMAVLVLVLVIDFISGTSGSRIARSSNAVSTSTSSGERSSFTKRTFADIQCKGVFNKKLYNELDRVCDDCYNLYQETDIYTLCRSNCFGSTYFKGCLDALLLDEEESRYDEMIEILGKK